MAVQRLPELVEAITGTLPYCQASPNDEVFIYSDSGRPKEIGELFVSAGSRSGAIPVIATGKGTIVLNGPIYTSPGPHFTIQEPVRLEFREDRVVEVSGGADARRLEQWFGSHVDPNVRLIFHMGFGYDRRCGPPPKPVETGDFGSWEAMNSGLIVAFGANKGLKQYGVQTAAKGHAD